MHRRYGALAVSGRTKRRRRPRSCHGTDQDIVSKKSIAIPCRRFGIDRIRRHGSAAESIHESLDVGRAMDRSASQSPPRFAASADAATCFDGAVKEQTALDRNRRTREKYLESYHGGRELLKLSRWRRKMKPYAQSLAVSIPVYLTLGILSWYLFGHAFVDLFSRLKRL